MNFRDAPLGARAREPALEDAFDNGLPFRRRVLLGALARGPRARVRRRRARLAPVRRRAQQRRQRRPRARHPRRRDDRHVLRAASCRRSPRSRSRPSCARATQARCRPTSSAFSRPRAVPSSAASAGSTASGIYRVSSTAPTGLGARRRATAPTSSTVMATGAPFVSEGLASRGTNRHIVVMAVPTHDARGRPTGVLAGALLVNALPGQRRVVRSRVRGPLGAGSPRARGAGRLRAARATPRSRSGSAAARSACSRTSAASTAAGDHLVAFATAPIPGLDDRDRPAARDRVRSRPARACCSSSSLIAAAAAIVFCLIGWLLLRARREADRQSARARQRGELSHALGVASFAAEVSNGLAEALATAFPDALSVVALEADDRLGLELAAVRGLRALRARRARSASTAHRDDRRLRVGRAVRAGDGGARSASSTPRSTQPAAARCARSTAPRCASAARAPIGALCLLFADERALDEKEQAHVAWCAEEAAQALDRARSYEHEHAVAVSLQRSLLSQDLPAIEGVELLGRYQAGSAGLEVGGDWYDVVRRSDGIVHITVGDVAGRGLAAAVLMGQMRNAFRAYAYDHTSPAELLRRMRRHVTRRRDGDGRLPHARSVHAGAHVRLRRAPAVAAARRRSGAVTRLDRACAPPLGFATPESIREADLVLAPGSTLVAYTDGLIERRGWSIDVGIDLLASVLGSSAGPRRRDPRGDRSCAMSPPRSDSGDDIALLVVRLARRARAHGHRDPGRSGDARRAAPAPAHVARAARPQRGGARGRRALDQRGLQQRHRARLRRPGRHDPPGARAPRRRARDHDRGPRHAGASRRPRPSAGAASRSCAPSCTTRRIEHATRRHPRAR